MNLDENSQPIGEPYNRLSSAIGQARPFSTSPALRWQKVAARSLWSCWLLGFGERVKGVRVVEGHGVDDGTSQINWMMLTCTGLNWGLVLDTSISVHCAHRDLDALKSWPLFSALPTKCVQCARQSTARMDLPRMNAIGSWNEAKESACASVARAIATKADANETEHLAVDLRTRP